ncbi:hypothetical protein CSQ80_09600 [Cyanobacterium aponinum IPPAS B-1201]|nr:hypothetical protein CSQ80_09600 [Cyanobacterium aponinum IPPAS B-1201]
MKSKIKLFFLIFLINFTYGRLFYRIWTKAISNKKRNREQGIVITIEEKLLKIDFKIFLL